MAVFSLLLWKGMGLPWYALGYFLLGGYRAARSFIYAQARPLVHPAQMGLAYGVAETFNSLSMTLAPLLAGVLYTQAPVVVYPVSLGLVAAGLAGHRPHLRRTRRLKNRPRPDQSLEL